MKKYTKLEIEIINLDDVDVIATSSEETPDILITKGKMVENFDSENVGLFK